MQNRWYRFQLGKRNMAYHNSSMRFKNFSANFVLFLTSSPATCDSISLIALWARSPRTCYRGTSFKNHVTHYGGYITWSPFSPARCRRVAVLPSAASSAPHFVLTFLFSNGSLVITNSSISSSYSGGSCSSSSSSSSSSSNSGGSSSSSSSSSSSNSSNSGSSSSSSSSSSNRVVVVVWQ